MIKTEKINIRKAQRNTKEDVIQRVKKKLGASGDIA